MQRLLAQTKGETTMVAREDFATKADLKEFKDEIIHEFHVAFGRVEDKLKFFAELQSKTIQHYDRIEKGKRTSAYRDSGIN